MATRKPLVLDDQGSVVEIAAGDELPAYAIPGGGGAQQVFVQQARPTATGPWVWWKTDESGQITNLIINDGA